MTKRLLTILSAGLSAGAIALASAASAEETRTFDLAAFDRVDVAAGVTAEISVGGEQSVRVETDKGDFEDLIIKVEDGELVFKREWKNSWGIGRKKAKYKLFATVADLNAVEASSGSTLKASGIEGGDFEVDASSGASIKLTGSCDTVTADGSSGASVSAHDLICTDAVADASSGASLSLHATQSVDAEASSGASVTVGGGAEKTRIKKSSGGNVRIRD